MMKLMISVWKAYVTFNMIARDPEVIKKTRKNWWFTKTAFITIIYICIWNKVHFINLCEKKNSS